MNRSENAVKLFESGYNCSQSIVLAFEDLLNIDKNTLSSLSSSFGGGISRLREVCGCVSAMAIIVGTLYGNYDVNNNEEKAKHYELVQSLALKFKKQTGSLNCATLLNKVNEIEIPIPEVRTLKYYQQRPCSKLIKIMSDILQEYIDNHE